MNCPTRRTKMANLKSQLSEFIKVEGIKAAVVVGRDGFVIEGTASDGNLDIEAVESGRNQGSGRRRP
jgi:uncharacterized protein